MRTLDLNKLLQPEGDEREPLVWSCWKLSLRISVILHNLTLSCHLSLQVGWLSNIMEYFLVKVYHRRNNFEITPGAN
jgi:hypothetical protein